MRVYTFRDLTGLKFGRLLVLRLDEEKTEYYGVRYWICQCDCGSIVSVRGTNLTRRKGMENRSCGCYKREISSINMTNYNIKNNRIEFDENLGCLRVYFNNCDDSFLCDIEDKDIVEMYCWYKNTSGYAANTNGRRQGRSVILFHRLVLEKYGINLDNLLVDHINHDTLDNRKFNLRAATYSENNTNKKSHSNTGERYISLTLRDNLYIVSVPNFDKQSFKDKQEAINYRDWCVNQRSKNEFEYDPLVDSRNKTNVIYPFVFINPEK